MQLPTVKIKHPDGYAIINEEDFVKGEHELFDDEAGDEFPWTSDEELRAMITNITGTAPHPNAKRETLINKLKAAKANG